jgi:hypothetical protein
MVELKHSGARAMGEPGSEWLAISREAELVSEIGACEDAFPEHIQTIEQRVGRTFLEKVQDCLREDSGCVPLSLLQAIVAVERCAPSRSTVRQRRCQAI